MLYKRTTSNKKSLYGRLKYNNVISYIDGKCMRSKKEAAFYQECKKRKKSGEIKDFQFQIRFNLPKKEIAKKAGIKPIIYVLDFIVINNDGSLEHIDVKGCKTGAVYSFFKAKAKLMKFFYNIDVKEI